MSIYEYDKDKVHFILRDENVTSLDDELDIEDFILAMNEYNEELEFLKKLKQKRVSVIDSRKKNVENKVDRIKELITATLKENKQKNRTFPGVGQVVVKKISGTYEIESEEDLLEYLKSEKEYDNATSNQINIDKKYVNKLFSVWDETGKLPSFVKKTEDKTSLQIKYDTDFEKAEVKKTSNNSLLKTSLDNMEDQEDLCMEDLDVWTS